MRVIRYDREGKWFSESSKDSITSEFYARQLHELLEKWRKALYIGRDTLWEVLIFVYLEIYIPMK
jgi:hypothetical protein